MFDAPFALKGMLLLFPEVVFISTRITYFELSGSCVAHNTAIVEQKGTEALAPSESSKSQEHSQCFL